MGRCLAMEKKIRIAILSITQGVVNRGAEVFVKELVVAMDTKIEVEVIEGRRTLPKRWPILWRVHIDWYGLQILWFTLRNLKILFKNKYDLVIPMNGGWQSFLVRVATLLYGGKMMIVGQSGIGWDDRFNLWTFPDCFVAITSVGLDWAKKVNPKVFSVYIPNGVDLKKFSPRVKGVGLGLSHPLVVCVGALVHEKRIDLVVRAVSTLSNVNLLVVGDGPEKAELTEMGKRLLGRRFEVVSASHKQMPGLYRAADIFCLVPKKSESFGIVFIEAMASGLSVVTIDDKQRREIVGQAGIFVEKPEDKTVLGNAINSALEKKWGDLPRKQAEKYAWEEIGRRYYQLITDILKNR